MLTVFCQIGCWLIGYSKTFLNGTMPFSFKRERKIDSLVLSFEFLPPLQTLHCEWWIAAGSSPSCTNSWSNGAVFHFDHLQYANFVHFPLWLLSFSSNCRAISIQPILMSDKITSDQKNARRCSLPLDVNEAKVTTRLRGCKTHWLLLQVVAEQMGIGPGEFSPNGVGPFRDKLPHPEWQSETKTSVNFFFWWEGLGSGLGFAQISFVEMSRASRNKLFAPFSWWILDTWRPERISNLPTNHSLYFEVWCGWDEAWAQAYALNSKTARVGLWHSNCWFTNSVPEIWTFLFFNLYEK